VCGTKKNGVEIDVTRDRAAILLQIDGKLFVDAL
jgi:hypothetical protein